MVCALSVFNGFNGLVEGMFNSFDPELKITAVKGKVFDSQDDKIKTIKNLSEIAVFSESLEDNVLVKYRDRQVPATLKGVSDNFGTLTKIDSILIDGEFKLRDEVNNLTVIGIGLAGQLGIRPGYAFPLEIYAPKRNVQVNLANPSGSFSVEQVFLSGVFCVNQPAYDETYFLVPIDLARNLFSYETQVSAIELKLKQTGNINQVKRKIQQILGDDYIVKNQYEQQENAFRMMNIEKWVTFLILCFIMIIATFNVISSLAMLIIEKKEDTGILRSLGADNQLISKIFLFEGWIISGIGAIAGIVLGIIVCLIQIHFGLIKLGDQIGMFVTNTYPVRINISDLIYTFLTVATIGFLAALYSVKQLNSTNK